MTTGNTNVKHFRLYADEADLSGDARNFSQVGEAYEEVDETGWSDEVKNFQPGRHSMKLEGFQAVFNTITAKSYSELSANEEYIVSMLFGVKAAPAVGDCCFSAPLITRGMKVRGDGPVMVEASFIGPEQGFTLPSKCWGFVLAINESHADTWNGTTVDLGAAQSSGCAAYLHVIATSSGNYELKIQDSANGSDWATLLTFTSTAGAVAAEQQIVAAAATTPDRYVRIVGTKTAGTIQIVVTLVPYE